MSDRFHVLILSVGSLLGQNLLDALEGRRPRLRVTGIDSNSENPRVFRCDKAYRAPQTESPDFQSFLRRLIETEKPDLVLAGRDHDVLALAELVRSAPQLRHRIPGGSVEAARIMNDKGLSHRFAQEYNLPFAQSFLLETGMADTARVWAQRCGFPIVAKPREGYGSLGIRVICDEVQFEAFLRRHTTGFLLQQMVDVSDAWRRQIAEFRLDAETGIPFFFHIPEENQFAGQTLIRPDGTVGTVFTSRSLMVLGRPERTVRWDDPALAATTRAFAGAISAAGWRGLFNLQCRRTPDGYVGIEMNGRMTGSTSSRGYLGYDELRVVIREFCQIDIGPDERYGTDGGGTVYRSHTDYFVSDRDKQALNETGVWLRASTP